MRLNVILVLFLIASAQRISVAGDQLQQAKTVKTVATQAMKPNIIFIITDDMGYSDLGCYGGEIKTPNLDKLAASGMKFSQFYNCGKCEPSRAAIISGHQWWTYNPNVAVRKESPNIGEVVKQAGYRTMMVGKWHCEGIPYERGFDRHFGFMGGGTDFFLGDSSFTLDGKPWKVPKDNFYVTYALTEYADKFLREEHERYPEKPFMMYLAYNAPHASIQAPKDEVAKYRGKYLKGWDELRKARFEKQKELGLIKAGWEYPRRPENIPDWNSLDEKSKQFEDLRMSTYAAMVDCVDQGVGKLMSTLEELKLRENTLVIFLNDNGASPNDRVRIKEFGTPGSNWNVGLPWAHLSTTPYKFYKRTQHSGGVTTPFIASWPRMIKPQVEFNDQACHVTDIMPTLVELTGAEYPYDFGGKQHPPLQGRSFAPILLNNEVLPARTLHFSLFSNIAVVHDGYRLVTAYSRPWELYDLNKDRTEQHNLASSQPEKLKEMLKIQEEFYNRPDVRLRLSGGEREPEYAPIYRENGKIGPGSKEDVENPVLAELIVKAQAEGKQLSDEELNNLKKDASKKNPKPKKKKAE